MDISYDWYKIFCCAAECGSLTLAAEKLYISQPAVSQSIRQLEETLGCQLFLRTPKGVKLTAEGEILYRYVAAGIESIQTGEHHLMAMLRLDAGEIKVGASDMTLEFFLLPYLEEFHSRYPDVKIAITNNPTPQTLELLRQGKIDFAAVSGPLISSDFDVIAVREIQDIFICGNKTSVPDNSTIAELKDRLILLESNTSTRVFLDNEFRKRGFAATPQFELATSPQIVGLAARNLGVGCVVADFAKGAIERREVREIKVGDPLPPRSLYVVQGPEKHSKAAQELLSIILKEDF